MKERKKVSKVKESKKSLVENDNFCLNNYRNNFYMENDNKKNMKEEKEERKEIFTSRNNDSLVDVDYNKMMNDINKYENTILNSNNSRCNNFPNYDQIIYNNNVLSNGPVNNSVNSNNTNNNMMNNNMMNNNMMNSNMMNNNRMNNNIMNSNMMNDNMMNDNMMNDNMM
ncbi:hypothetical protein PFTANZ_04386, partial [Plasmodium falciparum Tanzania (2000708)]